MNRRITVLQTGALPLGYVTKYSVLSERLYIITNPTAFVKPFFAKSLIYFKLIFDTAALPCRRTKKGLYHLDAEGVIGFSSAYRRTPESPSASKKRT